MEEHDGLLLFLVPFNHSLEHGNIPAKHLKIDLFSLNLFDGDTGQAVSSAAVHPGLEGCALEISFNYGTILLPDVEILKKYEMKGQLRELTPFHSRIHAPLSQSFNTILQAKCSTMAEKYGLFSTKEVLAMNIPICVQLVLPSNEVDIDTIVYCTEMYLYLNLVDDILDHFTIATETEITSNKNGVIQVDPNTLNLPQDLKEQTLAIEKETNGDCVPMMESIAEFKHFQVMAKEKERSLAENGTGFKDFNEYMAIGEMTIGWVPGIEIVSFCRGLVLTKEVREDPDLRKLLVTSCRILRLVNDMSSLRKEVEKGESMNSLLIGCGITVDRIVNQLLPGLRREYLEIQMRLEKIHSDGCKDLQSFFQICNEVVDLGVRWTLSSAKYVKKDCEVSVTAVKE